MVLFFISLAIQVIPGKGQLSLSDSLLMKEEFVLMLWKRNPVISTKTATTMTTMSQVSTSPCLHRVCGTVTCKAAPGILSCLDQLRCVPLEDTAYTLSNNDTKK